MWSIITNNIPVVINKLPRAKQKKKRTTLNFQPIYFTVANWLLCLYINMFCICCIIKFINSKISSWFPAVNSLIQKLWVWRWVMCKLVVVKSSSCECFLSFMSLKCFVNCERSSPLDGAGQMGTLWKVTQHLNGTSDSFFFSFHIRDSHSCGLYFILFYFHLGLNALWG